MTDRLFELIERHLDRIFGILLTIFGMVALLFVLFYEHPRESEIVLCLFGIGALVFAWITRKH